MHINTPEDKFHYLVDNYWESYNFADSATIANRTLTQQAFVGYATLLSRLEPAEAEQSIHALLSRCFSSSKEAFSLFTTLFEECFYDPNSPFLNEELYIPALQYIVDNQSIESIDKLRPQMLLELALKNRVGTIAADFEYTLNSGAKARMHKIEASHLILYFNNPDCHDCARVKEYIVNSEVINALYQSGELKILSIYPDDDLEAWRANSYPDIMINGYDSSQQLTEQRTYDLKAIPTLYLLDSHKSVVLKDAAVERIAEFLASTI